MGGQTDRYSLNISLSASVLGHVGNEMHQIDLSAVLDCGIDTFGHHLGAAGMQQFRDVSSDAAGGPSHDGDLAFNFVHGSGYALMVRLLEGGQARLAPWVADAEKLGGGGQVDNLPDAEQVMQPARIIRASHRGS